MELLKSIIVDFCLFSLIEGWVLTQFYEKICNCRKFKWFEIFILSFVNCIISQVFSPVIYQILIILWISFYLYILNKIKYIDCLKYSLKSMIFILIIEMIYNIVCESLFNFDGFNLNKIILFLFIIPIKILEIIIIRGSEKMKLWLGSIEK